ncbi:MAG: TonB-dependent receptor [Pseudomonadota bacterium]|nr:TonB-dependent receptor [Pseudomonadota bacterium]
MKYLFLLATSLTLATPAIAQCTPGDEDCHFIPVSPAQSADPSEDGGCCFLIGKRVPSEAITVVASGTAQRVSETGQSISVIGANEIASVQGPDLTRVLERLPGVSLARSGPLGSQTSLFVRGANSQQLVVTLDGVRLADVAAPSGGFDLGTLMTGGIDKIELLRGSNSVVWGSDAIGGVLALTSAQIDGVRAGLEYGANDTLTADATLGTSGNGYGVTVSGGHVRSDGISAYAPGTEADGFRQWHGSLRGYASLTGNLSLVAAARYADSRVDFDGFPPPTFSFADTPEVQTTRQGSGRIGLDYATSAIALKLGLAYSDTRRDYFDDAASTAPNFATSGRSWRADFSGRADLTDSVTLDFGADSEWTKFSTSFDPENDARLSSAHLLLGYHADGLHLSAGVRVDDHDRFGTHWTFGANGSYELADNLRLRASYGEGFKAPTLYQLYGFGGNVALRPETSKAYEAGLEYGDRSGSRHIAITLFRRDSRNLIDYVFPAGYFNTGRTRAEGVEVEGGFALTDQLRARLAYSNIKATDRATGRDLPRRPRDLASAGLDWETPVAGLKLGADLRFAGDSFDDRGNFTRLDGYGLLTLRASLPLGERFELYGRVENVTDSDYQTVAGYGTYGRSAFVGVRAKW